ncbi:MAG: GNAT family N-acetyltransferase [Caldilineaceae bacterium]
MSQPKLTIAEIDTLLQQQLPAGYTLRPSTLADVSGAVAMHNASAIDTLGAPQFTEEEFRADWQEPGFTLATDSRVVTTAEGQIVGTTDAVANPPYVRNLIWARVHPAFRGRGIGTVLTRWAESRLLERLDEAPAGARVTVDCFNLDTHTAAKTLLTELGYHHERSYYRMKIELSAPPPLPAWPAGMTIRTMIPKQEEAAVYRAKEEAFQDHWGYVATPFEEGFALWQHHLQHNPDHDPTLFFLALDGDEIAGYALCDPKITDDPAMGWIANLGVRRPWRRRGLALALLHHAFGEFYRRGVKKVGLGVDAGSLTGATRLYEKAGMKPFRQYNTYEKELRPGQDLVRR